MDNPSQLQKVYATSERIAELHAVLTSPRGKFFRARLLQEAHTQLDRNDLDRLCRDSELLEYERHIQKLVEFSLIEVKQDGDRTYYHRTVQGDRAINVLREFERRLDEQVVVQIHNAVLGVNSIRLFLKLYDFDRAPEFSKHEVIFDASEIGRICLFLPRTIEGYAAVDKLNEAGILTSRDDTRFVFCAVRARAFYQYLKSLLMLTN